MTDFLVYPAIDLREGKVVRLVQGDLDRLTTYGSDPVSTARRWVEAGTRWIHVVNLDGAFGNDTGANHAVLADMIQEISTSGVNAQFGGGIRTLDDIKAAMDLGLSRVILGTAAASNPEMVAQAVTLYGPDSIGVGIDARDGEVRIHGWQDSVQLSPIELGLQMGECGVQTLVFTNIARDGAGTGVDVSATVALSDATGLSVIASGGVASLADIRGVKKAGLPGVIVGRALYEGLIELEDALAC